MLADRADRRARQAGRAGQADQEHELLPDRLLDVQADFDVDPAFRARRAKCLDAGGNGAVVFAEHQFLQMAGMFDHARFGDIRLDVANPAEYVLRPEHAAQHVILDHAVLERHHRGVRTEQCLDLRGSLLGVPQLDAEQHQVDRFEGGGIVCGDDLRQVDVAQRTSHPQALRAQRVELPAPGDERHVVPALRQSGAEVPADAAGAHHRDPHAASKVERSSKYNYTRRMGRNRSFDVDEALASALRTFWRHGYDATSMQDMCQAMSIQPGSVYATFGNKRDLFLTALRRYAETVSAEAVARVTDAPSGMQGLRAYFAHLIDAMVDGERRWGCLITNTLVEFATRDPELADLLTAHLANLRAAFATALTRAAADGELRPGADRVSGRPARRRRAGHERTRRRADPAGRH